MDFTDFMYNMMTSSPLKTWQDVEKEYGIKFRNDDGSFRLVNEVLDDVYLKLTKDEALELITDIYFSADNLYNDSKNSLTK